MRDAHGATVSRARVLAAARPPAVRRIRRYVSNSRSRPFVAADHDQLVAGHDPVVAMRVDGHLVAAPEGDRRQVEPPDEVDLAERPADEGGGRPDLGDAEAGRKVEVVDDVRDRERMGDPRAHLALGVDDAIGADTLEDRAVERGRGLRDHVAHAQVLECHRREDAGLRHAADRDDRVVELARADRAQRDVVARVELHCVSDARGDLVHARLVTVDREHLVPEPHQLQRRCRAEAAEADHENRSIHLDSSGVQPMRMVSTAGR